MALPIKSHKKFPRGGKKRSTAALLRCAKCNAEGRAPAGTSHRRCPGQPGLAPIGKHSPRLPRRQRGEWVARKQGG